MSLIPHQRSSFLQLTEIHNWLKCREEGTVECPSPIHISETQPLHLRLRENHRRGDRKIIRTRGPEHLILDSIPWV